MSLLDLLHISHFYYTLSWYTDWLNKHEIRNNLEALCPISHWLKYSYVAFDKQFENINKKLFFNSLINEIFLVTHF